MTTKTKSSKAKQSGTRAPVLLVGTDFSSTAKAAANVAAALAQRLDGSLDLVHVSVIPAYPPLRRKLREEAERLRRSGALVHETLLNGNADEELVKRSQLGSCRLIVVSSLGKRRSERWLLGSVSERTAERATVPTLVVRDPAPFEAWTRGQRQLKVFVAFNFTVTSEAAMRWVKELQAIGPCDVVVGYVDWPPEQRTRLGGSGSLPLVGNLPDVQAVLERDVRTRAVELLGDMPFRLRVEANWGRPDARLAEMAKEEGSDVIAVGSHQYRGFERLWHTSVSRGLLHSATMSVAVVPLSTLEKRGADMAPAVRRVLVTTDFSELANHAIPHAYSLVRGGGTVYLVHVAHPQQLPGGEYLQGPSDRRFEGQHAKHIQAAIGKLRALIPAEAALRGVITEVEVVEHRDVAEAIGQVAERFGVDIICLGTHGGSGLSKALMGSVAQKVMTNSERPLLVVRPPVE
ncbi:MAG: universal stress protein [Verrucomicrobiales bacterium]|nr:universal stress protein [Verrucomicrobiales bacterium]